MRIFGVTGTENDGVLTSKQQRALNDRQALTVIKVKKHWIKYGERSPYPLVAMPTGFGKGRVVSHLIQEKKLHTLLVVGTKNILLDQSADVLTSLVSDETAQAKWSVLPNPMGDVVLATWQGLGSHLRHNPKVTMKYGLAVVDEVHNMGTKQRLQMMERLRPHHVVGMTATAYRSSGDFRTPESYGFKIVDSMPLPECINKRWLSPLIGLCIDTAITLPGNVLHGGYFNAREAERAIRGHPKLFPWIADDLATRFLPQGMKTIIVVNRVNEEACIIAERLMKRGFKVGLAVNKAAAKRLSGRFITLDAIRRYKLPHSHPDSIQVLISPQVIGEGFDAPATECVVWASPTMSALRYTQVVGRGARRCLGKKYCLVIDYVYLIENYGYSYNFSQFLPKEDIRELENGLLYVGPEDVGKTITLPSSYIDRARMVSVMGLQSRTHQLAGDWLMVTQIAKEIGRGLKWIRARISQDFPTAHEFRKGFDGKVVPHYSPEVLEKLRELARLESQSGDWLSVPQIAKETKRSQAWVKRRLTDYFPNEGERRLTQNGHPGVHYPKEIVSELKKMADAEHEAQDWLNATQIARIEEVKRSDAWVTKFVKDNFPNQGELRLDKGGNLVLHYPPEVVRKVIDQIKKVQNFLTIEQMATQIGRVTKWVRARLEEHSLRDKGLKRNKDSQVLLFPPSVFAKLNQLSKEQGNSRPHRKGKKLK